MEDAEDVGEDVGEIDQQHLRFCRMLSTFCLSWQYRFHLSDVAVSALLMLIGALLTMMNIVVKSDLISAMLTCLPNTVAKCQHLLGVKNFFQTIVCCKKCNALYQFKNCFDKINGKLVSKRCTHIEFPNHSMPSFRRKQCGVLLLKEVRIGSKCFNYPFRNYCYKILIESLNLTIS